MKIYSISGLGANEEVFQNIQLPSEIKIQNISWLLPYHNESISDYASRMAQDIEDTEDFILFGLSFGGIMVQEVAKIKKPKAVVLFNTIKSDKEKPWWIRINKHIRLYKLFPYFILNHTPAVAIFSYLTQKWNPKRPNLSSLYTLRDSRYTRWAFEQIVYWDNKINFDFPVHHLHGNLDMVFPIWNIENAVSISGGGHLAVYEKSEAVNHKMEEILLGLY